MSLVDPAYYDESYPPSLWAPEPSPSTGATAGIPGTWTPADSAPPATVAALQGGIPNAVTASPATPWTTGQFVQTATAGAAGRATWTGTGWVGGVAALEATVAASTVADVQAWVEAHPEDLVAVRDAEAAGKARTTLLAWLDDALAAEGSAPAPPDASESAPPSTTGAEGGA